MHRANWRNLGHGLLNIIGMCPCIIGVASDVINSIWYYAEKDYAMGTLSLFCALPGIGDVGNCIKFLKGTKALKYFQVGTKFVGNAVIFGASATGAYRSVKEVYQNIKDGDLLSLDTLVNTASAGINVISMILSGKQVIGAGKDVRSIYLEKQESKWSSKKSAGYSASDAYAYKKYKESLVKEDVLENSKLIISGDKFGDKKLIAELTKDGSSISDWAKMESIYSYTNDYGTGKIHYYKNIKTGEISYYGAKMKISVPKDLRGKLTNTITDKDNFWIIDLDENLMPIGVRK